MTLAMNSEPREDLAFLVWDTYEITKYAAQGLQEEDPELSDDEAYNQASQLHWIYEDEWDYMLEALTDKMQEINPEGSWHCDASGLGWQHRSGSKAFQADTGKEFLSALLPNTECTFQVYLEGEGDEQTIRIVNSHHDAMGEVYEIRKATEDEDNED